MAHGDDILDSDFSDHVGAIREFTRFYTRVIGILEEGLLHTPYSVTEARIIFELAQRQATDLIELRRELGVDAGYMSRIMNRFEADGLITRERSDADGRRQVLRLTDHGRNVFATLDARSAEQVSGLLEGLTDTDRRRLLTAMTTVREVLGRQPTPPRTVVLRAPRSGDYGWVIARHGALYAAEHGWNTDFEALVAKVITDYLYKKDPEREAAWIAEVDGEAVGCIFCTKKNKGTARLRLLLVEPSARGLGIGTRLVDECLRFATDAGYSRITLWTNNVLHAARRIYEAAGFELAEEEPHHSFGHDLVGQYWTRTL